MKHSVAIDRKFRNLNPALSKKSGGVAYRRMLHRRRDDTRASRMLLVETLERHVVALGSAGGEDYLAGRCPDERRNLLARPLHVPPHQPAETVDARRVAVAIAEERQHGFKDFGGYASGSVVVKVDGVWTGGHPAFTPYQRGRRRGYHVHYHRQRAAEVAPRLRTRGES